LGVAGLVVYGCIILFLFFTAILGYCTSSSSSLSSLEKNVRIIFRVILLLFAAVRLTWVACRTFIGENTLTFVTNRVAIVLYLTTFTLVIFYWAEQFHKNYYETSGSFMPRLGTGFIILNVVVYIGEIIIILMWALGEEAREGSLIYEINIVVDVVLSCFISIAFFVYGLLLFCSKRNVDDDISQRNKELVKLLMYTIVFTACFMCRVFMFLYRPITGLYLNNTIFVVFGYYVPELVPAALQMYIAEQKQTQEEEDNKFIEGLYREYEDDITPPALHSNNSDKNSERIGLLKSPGK